MRPLALLLLAACADSTPGEPEPPGSDSGTPTSPTDPTVPTDPDPSEIVFVGQLIGGSVPSDPWLAEFAAGSSWPPGGAALQLFVSRATTAEAIEAGLIGGLQPTLLTVQSAETSLRPGPTEGSYVLDSYSAGIYPWGGGGSSSWRTGAIDGWEASASVFQPASAEIDLPETHPAGAPLTLDYPNQGFTTNVAVVLDASGAVTWSNDPEGLGALYDANAEDATSVTLPAEAFPAPGSYAVGLAACTRTFPVDLTDLDPDLTSIRAGLMTWWPIAVE